MTAHRSRHLAKTKPAAALAAGVLALVASAAAAEPSSRSPGPMAVFENLAQASARASRAVHRTIPFEANCVNSPCGRALSKAATATSDAIAQISTLPDSRTRLNAVRKVRLAEAPKASIMLADSVLSVTVAPAAEPAEWPSMEQILQSFPDAPG